ncbi:molybdopterin-dependent oxidoreductase [Nonomuraea ferruginea]|uniref:molybdopterin-dependent oxidoreductase n=1 Tax=Nonomuraea ferruginea TaxID=46174 RepID=UPI00361F13C7
MGGSEVNQTLVRLYFEVREGLHDPVAAWAKLTANSEVYRQARGGRRVPLDDATAAELAAAAIVHTASEHGADQVAALATSPLAGLVRGMGGAVLTEQSSAPEQLLGPRFEGPRAEDWANAAYVLLWGENNRNVRAPGSPWVIAGRYKGQKVVAIGPHPTRLSDETLVVRPGTDGALAMAVGHVLLKEFFLDRPAFAAHAMARTDLPALVRLRELEDGLVPGGLLGRDAGRLSLYGGDGAAATEVLLPRFDVGPGVLRRGVPAVRDGEGLVTTVFDLLLAVYGLARPGLPGSWPDGYDDKTSPYTPGWQEAHTGVAASRALKLARELGVTAEKTGGRCIVVPGWLDTPHADTAYRAMLALLVLTGCRRVGAGVGRGGRAARAVPGAARVRRGPGGPGGVELGAGRRDVRPADVADGAAGRGARRAADGAAAAGAGAAAVDLPAAAAGGPADRAGRTVRSGHSGLQTGRRHGGEAVGRAGGADPGGAGAG